MKSQSQLRNRERRAQAKALAAPNARSVPYKIRANYDESCTRDAAFMQICCASENRQ
jgi:hypothetical protein